MKLNIEDLRVGMKVFENKSDKRGTVTSVHKGTCPGCDITFDDGDCISISEEEFVNLEEDLSGFAIFGKMNYQI